MIKFIQTIAGLLTGLLVVLFINNLIQGISVKLFLDQPINFSFHGIGLTADYFSDSSRFWSSFCVIITPIIFSIVFTELGLILLIKKENGKLNITTLVFILVNLGFLLIYLIRGIISLIATDSVSHDFISLLKNSDYSYVQQLIFMLMFAVLLFAYINIILKRMRRNLPTTIQNINRKY